MFVQPKAVVAEAWNVIVSLLKSGAIKPIVAKNFPLADAAEALRYLIEERPFGRVILTILTTSTRGEKRRFALAQAQQSAVSTPNSIPRRNGTDARLEIS
jgi:hypothetical protein